MIQGAAAAAAAAAGRRLRVYPAAAAAGKKLLPSTTAARAGGTAAPPAAPAAAAGAAAGGGQRPYLTVSSRRRLTGLRRYISGLHYTASTSSSKSTTRRTASTSSFFRSPSSSSPTPSQAKHKLNRWQRQHQQQQQQLQQQQQRGEPSTTHEETDSPPVFPFDTSPVGYRMAELFGLIGGDQDADAARRQRREVGPFSWLEEPHCFHFFASSEDSGEEHPQVRASSKSGSFSMVMDPAQHRRAPATVIVLPAHSQTSVAHMEVLSWFSQSVPHVKFLGLSPPKLHYLTEEGKRVRLRAWYDEDERVDPASQQADFVASLDKLYDVVATEVASGVPLERIMLLGVGQGGGLALHLGLALQDRLEWEEGRRDSENAEQLEEEGEEEEGRESGEDQDLDGGSSSTSSSKGFAGVICVGGYLPSFNELMPSARGRACAVNLFQSMNDPVVAPIYVKELSKALTDAHISVQLSAYDQDANNTFGTELAGDVLEVIDEALPGGNGSPEQPSARE